ncbi:MAG: hypothetical protein J7K61_06595 [Thermoplasmata archaeon]|nr:hypothetical protein [Thermoplasmata archaeon]
MLIFDGHIKIVALLEIDGEEREIKDGIHAEELLKMLGLYPDEAIIIVDGKPITCHDVVEGRRVRVIRVGSRG